MSDQIFTKILHHRKIVLATFFVVCLFSLFTLKNLKFNFEFEQFFPQGDEDLEFFKKFTAEFENDDNFLFLALNNHSSVFDTSFLKKVHDVSLSVRQLPYVATSQSITTIKYPLKTPFGYSLLPVVHLDNPQRLIADSAGIVNDERFNGYFIGKDKKSTAIVIKTKNNINVFQSDSMLNELEFVLKKNGFKPSDYHLLGRAYFQSELVQLQKREVIISSAVSFVLVSLILWVIFGSWWSVLVCIIGVLLSFLIFLGYLSLAGRELTLMSALYPVLILIVGSSDVIHIMSKYIDTVGEGQDRIKVMVKVIKEIGLATFLTSATTAIGFATLYTSRLSVIRDFGINAAIGVLIAFFVVVVVVPCLLIAFDHHQLNHKRGKAFLLDRFASSAYHFGLKNPLKVIYFFLLVTVVSIFGITKISTNYKLIDNLPIDARVTNDFLFFEKYYAGFRPLEFAISVNPPYKADSYAVVKEIDKLEKKLGTIKAINSILSQNTLYKSVSMMYNGNQKEYYKIPDNQNDFEEYHSLVSKMKGNETSILINKNNDKTRISTIVLDVGADSIKNLGIVIDQWVKDNIDPNIMKVRRTGTGLILDKNSIYVTESLVWGLLWSVILISILMAFLLKNVKMLFIFLVPNLLPLLFAGAILGYFNIELEAGISIIFSVVFGISVDDTIHFISRYELCLMEGMDTEEALHTTFKDSGKAIILTTIILFFGFLVMLFSKYPPGFMVGVLISLALITAMPCDLYLLPIMIRKFYPHQKGKFSIQTAIEE